MTFTANKATVQQGTQAITFVDESVPMIAGAAIGTTGYTTYSVAFNYTFESFVPPIATTALSATHNGETIGYFNIIHTTLPTCE